MKKKHKFQKFLNSVVKSHEDIEENKKEIENNVKKMMEILENNSKGESDRSDFLSLGNDLKKLLHDLYGRHDMMIGKIKNKVHHRERESSSESSDSGSEDSSEKDGPNKVQEQKIVQELSLNDNQFVKEQIDSLSKKNAELEAQTTTMHTRLEEIQHQAGEMEDELQTVRNNLKHLDDENGFLKEEIEKSKEKEGKLLLRLTGLQEENDVLMSEKEKNSSMQLQTDNSIIELKSELEKIGGARKLKGDNNFLKEELEKKAHELVHMKQQIVLTSEEHETLRTAVGELKSVNDSLSSENASLLFENQDMKAQEETSIQKVSNLNEKLLIMEDENGALKSEVLTLSAAMHEADKIIRDKKLESEILKEDISSLHDTVADLNRLLKDKDDEINVMTLESSESRNVILQAEERIVILSEEAERMKNENSMLSTGHVNLKLEMEGKNQELLKLRQALETAESETNSLREENYLLLTEHENLKLELEGNDQKLSKLKQALEATEFERNSLIEEKTGILSKINEGGIVIDGLKAKIEEVENEKSQLQLKISNLDVEIQSANLQLTDVKNELVETELERNSLVEEKSGLLSKINEDGMIIDGLKARIEEVESENSQLLLKISNLDFEIQSSNLQLNDVKNMLAETESERKSLLEEKSSLLSKINEGETEVHTLKAQIEEVESEKSQLQLKISNLAHEIQSVNLQFSDVKNALARTELERNSLVEEKSALLIKINEDGIVIDGLKSQVEELESEITQLQQKIGNLDQEIQSINLLLTYTKNVLAATEEEKKAFVSENSVIKSKLQEAEYMGERLQTELREVNLKNSTLLGKIEEAEKDANVFKFERERLIDDKVQLENKVKEFVMELKETNYSLRKYLISAVEESNVQLNHLEKLIAVAEEERANFISEIAMLTDKLQLAEADKEKLAKEAGMLREENVAVEKSNVQLNHLEKLIAVAEKERVIFISEIALLTDNLQFAEADNEKLEKEAGILREENTAAQQNLEEFQSRMVDLDRKLEDASSEMQDLRSKLEQAQKEVLHTIQTWIDSSKGDLVAIYTKKGDLDQELKKLAGISSENEVSLKKLEDRLKCKDSDQESLLQKYEELLAEHKKLEDSYSESFAKLETVEKKVEQLELKEEIIQRLERICAEQKKEIFKFGENYRELSEKLSSNEVGKVDAEKEIQRLEVQIRLANQKIKITETEYKEKEENWKRLVGGLKEELRLLSSHVLTWLRMSVELNSECKEFKAVIETSIRALSNDIQELESTSLESIKSIKKQLAECLLELQTVKACLEAELHGKKRLESENHELAVGVTDKERIISKMKNEASQSLAKLAEMEKEIKMLKKRAVESEKNLKEKEREGLDKDEEKREAIRQLCLQIEYHWENHNHLVRNLSSARQNRRTS